MIILFCSKTNMQLSSETLQRGRGRILESIQQNIISGLTKLLSVSEARICQNELVRVGRINSTRKQHIHSSELIRLRARLAGENPITRRMDWTEHQFTIWLLQKVHVCHVFSDQNLSSGFIGEKKKKIQHPRIYLSHHSAENIRKLHRLHPYVKDLVTWLSRPSHGSITFLLTDHQTSRWSSSNITGYTFVIGT